jgi:outer membrane protein OmpA-like peptidoglycan-associated protein
MRNLLIGSAVVAASTLCGAAAWAQSNPSSDQILNALRPTPDMLHGATRGIRMPSAAPAPAGQASAAPPARPAVENTASAQPVSQRAATSSAPSVNLVVEFKSGSADLTPQAINVLDRLGKALTDPSLTGYRFKIEGHTDTVGTPGENQALSERRAAAVASYLTSKFGITGARLEPVGVGSSDPLVPTPDQTAEPRNRRVQVVNLGA